MNCMTKANFTFTHTAALLLVLFAFPASDRSLAQDSAANAIEEVIVTAQKREQSLSDVGISVTAFSAEDLSAFGWNAPGDLANQTPNMNVNQVFGNSVPNVSIRGIGLNDYAVNNNPAVGVYLDEVYLVSPVMLSFQLFDLERVEVLKGPQGTLYGRNTTAGAVNFVSRRPGEEANGYLDIDYGSFERMRMQGAVGGPFGEAVSGRLAFSVERQADGHQDNRVTGDSVGEVDRMAFRAILQFDPSESLSALATFHSGRDESDTWLVKVDNIFTPADDTFFPGDPFESGGHQDTQMDVESDGATFSVDWDLSDSIRLTSITGLVELSRAHMEDRDGTELNQLDGMFLNEIEQFSQELRLTLQAESLVVILGATFSDDEVESRDLFETNDFFTTGIFPFRAVGNEYDQKTESNAAFLNAEWQVNQDWRLVSGLRYTDEDKVFSNAFTYIYVDALPSDGGTEIAVYPGVREEYGASDVSGKIGLDYTGFENTLLYFTLSKGFKSGNFQGQLTFTPSDLAPFDEENVVAFEAGFKSRLLDSRMRLEGSAFYYDYEDMQLYGPIYTEPIDPLFGIANVGDAEIRGAELDLLWRMTGNLDVRFGLGLLDAEVTESRLTTVEEGSWLPNSPEVNFNFRADYSRPVWSHVDFRFSLYGNYKDKVAYDVVRAPPEAVEDGFWLMNLRGGFAAERGGGGWEFYFWCRNLFDEEYRSQVLTSTVGYGETWGMPRTLGVGISYAW